MGVLIAAILFVIATVFQTGYRNWEKVYCTWLTFTTLSDNPYLQASWPAIITASVAGVLTVAIFLPWFMNERGEERSEVRMSALETDIIHLWKDIEELKLKIEQLEKILQEAHD